MRKLSFSRGRKVVPFPARVSEQVEAYAARALARRDDGSMTPGEIVELAIWRAESPDHDRVFREMEAIWHAIDPRAMPSARSAWESARRRSGVSAWRIAAAVSFLALAGTLTAGFLGRWRYDYATGSGELRRIALADGSRATLIGDTAMNVAIGRDGARRVELVRGDAYFEVTHDARRPFVVTAGAARIEDLGTGFWVRRQGRNGAVTVDHGSVALTMGGEREVLGRNEYTAFRATGIAPKRPIDARAAVAWSRGLYFVEDKPLGAVIERIDAFYPGKIFVLGDRLRHRPINAVVQLNDPGAWLGALGKTRGVRVRTLGPFVLIDEAPSTHVPP